MCTVIDCRSLVVWREQLECLAPRERQVLSAPDPRYSPFDGAYDLTQNVILKREGE